MEQYDQQTGLRTNRSSLVPWIILAVIAVGVLIYLWYRPEQPRTGIGKTHPAVGRSLSLLELEPLTGDGQPIRLDDVRGKVVLINFWGTWCPPCRIEFPHMVNLQQQFHARDDFRLLSVSCGYSIDSEEPDELRQQTLEFLRQQHADLPTYADPDGTTRIAMINSANLEGFGYPATILLDAEGVIRAVWLGYDDGYEYDMETSVAELLRS